MFRSIRCKMKYEDRRKLPVTNVNIPIIREYLFSTRWRLMEEIIIFCFFLNYLCILMQFSALFAALTLRY